MSGSHSTNRIITCGVPQGSTLGPLLFLIYINDLHKAFKNSLVHHFADDTNILYASKNIRTIESVMNYELKLLVDWLKANKLSLNAEKTELIIFHSPRKVVPHISIKIDNVKLKPCNSVQYLGISIDEVLSWNKQIEDLCKKLRRANGILAKIRHYISKKTCIAVYYSIFYTHLLYGCLCWNFSSKSNLDRIIKLQKTAVRIITFSDQHTHSNPLFIELNLLKVEDVFKFQIILSVYDFINNALPKSLNHLFEINNTTHQHDTRSKPCLHLPKFNSVTFGKNSLSYNGSVLWNDFSKHFDTTNISSKSFLKRKLKSIYKENYVELLRNFVT